MELLSWPCTCREAALLRTLRTTGRAGIRAVPGIGVGLSRPSGQGWPSPPQQRTLRHGGNPSSSWRSEASMVIDLADAAQPCAPGAGLPGDRLLARRPGLLRPVRRRLHLSYEFVKWAFQHYLPDGVDRADPYAFPLRAADLGALPPALILTAEFDPLRDEGTRLCGAAGHSTSSPMGFAERSHEGALGHPSHLPPASILRRSQHPVPTNPNARPRSTTWLDRS